MCLKDGFGVYIVKMSKLMPHFLSDVNLHKNSIIYFDLVLIHTKWVSNNLQSEFI
jgi:hypothetical protein